MPLSVHLLSSFDDEWQSRFRKTLDPTISLTIGDKVPEDPTYDILIGGRPERDHFENCPSCSTLVIPFAGIPAVTRELMRGFPRIAVHNLHHNAAPTAELALALMMAAAKRIVTTDDAMRRNDWQSRRSSEELLLEGRSAVILGYGAVGQRVARTCSNLGMQVTVLRRRVTSDSDGSINVSSIEELDELLPSADVLILALPLTDKTEGLLTKHRLAHLPENAIIVNIARGAIIEEKALYNELKSERIRAGLDVWYQYPKAIEEYADCQPSKYDFGKLRNVVMTPHLGGNSDKTEELRIEHLARLLNTAAQGEPIPNRVDVDAGY